MKKIFLILTGIFSMNTAWTQLKPTVACPAFVVDVLNGRINELYPSSTMGEIKGKFPCFTGAEEETTASKCGGGVFYKDKDIYFYSGRDYIEIREKFKGKLSIPLLGASRNNLYKWLGHAKMKDVSWDAFQTSYGTLVLYYNKSGKVNKLQFSTKPSEALSLCD